MKSVLRILSIFVGAAFCFLALIGLLASGLSDIAYVAVFLVLGCIFLFLGLHRSAAEKAERAAFQKEEQLRIEKGKLGQAAYAKAQEAQRLEEEAARAREAPEISSRLDQYAAERDAALENLRQQEERLEKAKAAVPEPEPKKPTINWETSGMRKKRELEERKAAAQEQGLACCPYCGSTSLSANKKGYGVVKGAVGLTTVGVLGLGAGNIGRQKVLVTCLNCGKQFKPGQK